MAGVIVHPVDRPAAKVAWFSERICGKKRYPVSFISDEISAPHNVIHKGEKFQLPRLRSISWTRKTSN
ncbi:hypothetical protein QYQ34_26960 (plasmid) [Klebsiella pneumoniae]|uniref:hypothetical protein n=1 Tax=Klebsiella pneumoniae TaxID=573 RepID=UPI00265ABF6B|nr:hypothetical protein [Klebsiella pneumoniae]WKG93818.1 hypothetical protein QYQ34_26960 [Klebsiella pneumoniae]